MNAKKMECMMLGLLCIHTVGQLYRIGVIVGLSVSGGYR